MSTQALNGKVVLVTGGTSGIGRVSAIQFAQAGAKVMVSGRREKEGNEVVKEIVKAGGVALFQRADVSKESDVKALVANTVEHFGRLDAAFNNAGVEHVKPLLEITPEEYRLVFDINVLGVALSMKYEAAAMLKNGGGSIINTSSVAGQVGFPGFSLYAATKHAVNGLTRSAALEWAKQGIRVNSVSPGPIQTDMVDRAFGPGESDQKKMIASMVPAGRIGVSEEVASAVLWLADPQNTYVTGQVIAVDGGFSAQ